MDATGKRILPLGTDKSTFQKNETCGSTLNGIVVPGKDILAQERKSLQDSVVWISLKIGTSGIFNRNRWFSSI